MAAVSSIIVGSLVAGAVGAGASAVVANQQRVRAEREGNRQKAEQENLLAQARKREDERKLLQDKSMEQQGAYADQRLRRGSRARGAAAALYGGSQPEATAGSATGAGGTGKTLLGT